MTVSLELRHSGSGTLYICNASYINGECALHNFKLIVVRYLVHSNQGMSFISSHWHLYYLLLILLSRLSMEFMSWGYESWIWCRDTTMNELNHVLSTANFKFTSCRNFEFVLSDEFIILYQLRKGSLSKILLPWLDPTLKSSLDLQVVPGSELTLPIYWVSGVLVLTYR